MTHRVTGVMLAALATLFTQGAQAGPPALRVGFAPFENQKEVLRKATPIVGYLSKRLGRPVKPFVAGDYPGIVEAMKGGKLDVAFLSPAALVLAEKVAGVQVVLKSAYKGRTHYYSAIITHVDSGVTSLKALKGRSFAFVDPGSTTGGVYPKLMLLNAGLNPATDFSTVINAGGHDASILAVVNRKVDAAATFANDDRGEDVPWKHILKDRAGLIRVLGYSRPIPNGAVAVGKHLPATTTEAIRRAFLDLSASEEGRGILKQMYLIERFVPASSADYDPVREAFTRVGLSLK